MKKIILIIIAALLFSVGFHVQGQTTKTNPGVPATIPASITYVGTEAEIAFTPNGALIYDITDESPAVMTVDFGSYDMAPIDDPANDGEGQLTAGKYLFQINNTGSQDVTVIVKGTFLKTHGVIALSPSGIVGYSNTGTGSLTITLEDFSMPNISGGDPFLLIMAKTGGTGTTSQNALNLKGFQWPAGTTYGPIDNQVTMGDPASNENSNEETFFLSTSLPITWIRVWVEGSQVNATGLLTGNDVSHVTCEYQSASGWEEVGQYDPGESFSHEASIGGMYRFVAHYTSGVINPTEVVHVKWRDVGYSPLAQLSNGQLVLTGLPAGSYQVAVVSTQGQTLLQNKIDFAEMQEERFNLSGENKMVIIKISGSSGSFTAKVVKNTSGMWNPLVEK